MKEKNELSPKWREEDGVIYFSVTSDGTTGEEWIKRLIDYSVGKRVSENEEWMKTLIERGYCVSEGVQTLLRSDNFKPTCGVTTEVVVLSRKITNNCNCIREIFDAASSRKLTKPNAEVACLIREMFTNEEMIDMVTSWIVVMHEPIKNSDGKLNLLSVSAMSQGARNELSFSYGEPDSHIYTGHSFAFAID